MAVLCKNIRKKELVTVDGVEVQNPLSLITVDSIISDKYQEQGKFVIQLKGLLPYNFDQSSAVVYHDEIHLLGGEYIGTTQYHYKYNGSEWTSVSTLPYDFNYGDALIYNDQIHIFGGTGNEKGHYKYNGTSWTSVSTLPYNFNYGRAIVYNDEIHVLGGAYSSVSSTNHSKKHYKYNGSSWTSVSTLPYIFKNGSVVEYNNEIHILGSDYSSAVYTKHYKYNGSSWTSVSTLPSSTFTKAILNDDKIYLVLKNGCSVYVYEDSEWKFIADWEDTTGNYFEKGSVIVYNGEIYMLGNYYETGTNTYNHRGKWYKYPKFCTWNEVSTLPYEFYNGSAVVYHNEIHILGGGNTTGHYKYNGSAWTSMSTLPYEFYNGDAIVYDNEIHILGGSKSGTTRYHYKYNGTSWTSVSTLPYEFYSGSAVVFNNEIYIWGTDRSTTDSRKFYKYNGSSWTALNTSYNFNYGAVAAFNNEIHRLGGISLSSNIRYQHVVYNPSTDSFTSKTLPYGFVNGSAVVFNNEIYMIGGEVESDTSNEDISAHVIQYKYNGTEWTFINGTLPYKFINGSAVVYNNEIHILGSSESDSRTKHYKYGINRITRYIEQS